MTYHLPIWVLLGILAAAVASTQADAQQVPQDDALFAEEQLRRSGSQTTYEQFVDEETGQLRTPVFEDDVDTPERDAEAPEESARDNTLTREPSPEGNSRARRAQQVGIVDPAGDVTPLANRPVQPVQGGGTPNTDDPYAPLGIRRGSFLLFPSLTQTIGFTDNADFAADGEESAFSLTDARLRLLSDWSIHQFSAEIGGSYQAFFNDTSDDLPVVNGIAELRLDHTRDFTTRWVGALRRTTESTSSNNLSGVNAAFVTNRPGVLEGSAFGEAEKQFGRLTGSLRGTVTRTVFEDADLNTGGTLSQDDRNNTLLSATLRLGYETSPAIQPFVESTVGLRRFDESIDRNGEERDSLLLSLRGGMAFNQGEKFNGEIAVGYSTERFDDTTLDSLSGVTIDGTINWSPERFTTVTATAQTAFSPSTNLGESGSITYAGTLGVARDVRANLTLSAQVLASLREYEGSDREDRTLQGTIGSEWRLNRTAAVIGELGYENVDSTDVDSSYEAFTARLGVRLQR